MIDRGGDSPYSQDTSLTVPGDGQPSTSCGSGFVVCRPLVGVVEAMMKSLQPCPSSPNCVSTQASDQGHGIVPYRYQKTLAGAKEALKTIVANLPRAKLVEEDEAYLHYEFTSLLLRFVDDVEFVFDDATKTIHFRSASRTGYSDLGVNRRRMEEIRAIAEGRL